MMSTAVSSELSLDSPDRDQAHRDAALQVEPEDRRVPDGHGRDERDHDDRHDVPMR